MLLLSPGPVAAQNTGKARRLGLLGPDTSDAAGPVFGAFVAELQRLGWTEGRNLQLVQRYGNDDRAESMDKAAHDLVGQGVELIYAMRGTASALAARKATQTLPVVFYSSADPVGLGLVASLSHPGGNLTGNAVSTFDLTVKSVELMAQALPRLRRIAFFMPNSMREHVGYKRLVDALQQGCQGVGAQLQLVDVGAAHEMESLIRQTARQGARHGDDAAMVYDFPIFRAAYQRIAEMCIENRLPTYGYAPIGFLMHYAEPRIDLARNAARYVDRILRGAKPADLPVEQVKTFELVVNLKTARALGLALPRSVLVRANEVIE